MIKAVIFDLDGLLVDTELISWEVYREFLKRYEIDFSKEEYVKNYSGKSNTSNVDRFIKTYGLSVSFQELVDEVLEIERNRLALGVELKEGYKDLLKFLVMNNYKIALATSSTKNRAISMLKSNNILNYFDTFVFSEDVVKAKPDPEIFLKACEKLEVNIDEVIVLEDSENGILASYNANIPVICIPDIKIPSETFLSKTIAVYSSLNEVIKYLKNSTK